MSGSRGTNMVFKKKEQPQPIEEDVVVLPVTKNTTSTLFIFKTKYGLIVYSSPVQNCDAETMTKLVAEYKRVHDLKDLMGVSVSPFITWLETKGYTITNDDVVDIVWS